MKTEEILPGNAFDQIAAGPHFGESILTKRHISHAEAREVMGRLVNSHFRQEPHARIGIPARPDYDDDLLMSAYIRQQEHGGAVPVDQWKIVIDEPVLIYVVHANAQFEKDDARRRSEWESWCVGRWIKHNKGGWMWHGLAGTVTHVAPLPPCPSPQKTEG